MKWYAKQKLEFGGYFRIMATDEEKCEFCGCSKGNTMCYYDCGCHKLKDDSTPSSELKITAPKEEKCEFCGCRGGGTICYYDCGCHKPKDNNVLPKK
ncbi:MAG: hypothetical protein ACW9W3_03330 [Candidatus Nitrosopumilus sp. bin_68KS]